MAGGYLFGAKKSRAPGRKAGPATYQVGWQGVGGAICVAGRCCVVNCVRRGGREGRQEGKAGAKKSSCAVAIKSLAGRGKKNASQDKMPFVPLLLCVLSVPVCVVCVCV